MKLKALRRGNPTSPLLQKYSGLRSGSQIAHCAVQSMQTAAQWTNATEAPGAHYSPAPAQKSLQELEDDM